MTVAQKQGPRTIEEWLAQPEERRVELIDGEFVEKAAPTPEHGAAQVRVGIHVGGPFMRRRGGPGSPGGWWIVSEVDALLDGRGYRPDVLGWRRERVPELPAARPVTVRPDWICEIASDSNRGVDTVTKLRRYHQAGIPHYWIMDLLDRTLSVYRHEPAGYLVALRAEASEKVRAEPFDAVELDVGVLFGAEPE